MLSLKSKVRSFAFAPAVALRAAKRAGAKGAGAAGGQACLARLALSLSNNTVELLDLLAPAGAFESEAGPAPEEVVQEAVQRLEQGGHRADIRAVALSPDDTLLLSASNSAVKVRAAELRATVHEMEQTADGFF